MNAHKSYYEGSKRGEIVKALLVNGACYYRSFDYLPWQREYAQRMLRKMRGEGIIQNRSSTDGVIVTLCNYNDIFDEISPLLTRELDEHYTQRGEAIRRRSLKRGDGTIAARRACENADALMLFHYSGVPAYFDEKKSIGEKGLSLFGKEVFYSSVELKRDAGLDTMAAGGENTINGRMNGVFLSDGGEAYMVYDIGAHTIQWSDISEYKSRIRTQAILADRSADVSIDSAIFVYSSDKVLEKVMAETPGKRRKMWLNTDISSYENIYFIPRGKRGMLMIQLLRDKAWRQELRESYLMEEELNAARFASTVADGVSEEEGGSVFTYIFCVPELLRFAKLKAEMDQAAKGAFGEPRKYVIYCYDFQKDFVEGQVNGIAEVVPVSFEATFLNKGIDLGEYGYGGREVTVIS